MMRNDVDIESVMIQWFQVILLKMVEWLQYTVEVKPKTSLILLFVMQVRLRRKLYL
jgi:hypothetical protein